MPNKNTKINELSLLHARSTLLSDFVRNNFSELVVDYHRISTSVESLNKRSSSQSRDWVESSFSVFATAFRPLSLKTKLEEIDRRARLLIRTKPWTITGLRDGDLRHIRVIPKTGERWTIDWMSNTATHQRQKFTDLRIDVPQEGRGRGRPPKTMAIAQAIIALGRTHSDFADWTRPQQRDAIRRECGVDPLSKSCRPGFSDSSLNDALRKYCRKLLDH